MLLYCTGVLCSTNLYLSRGFRVTLEVETAQDMFMDVLHGYLGVDLSHKNAFIAYAIDTDHTKAPIEVSCAIADKLIIDFSMKAKVPLWCDPEELEQRTENILRSANIRISSLLTGARARRGTVLLRT